MRLLFKTNIFSERRQTMLFSATQTRKVEDLAKISLKKEPLYVGVDDNKETATVDGLEQVKHKCYSKGLICEHTNVFQGGCTNTVLKVFTILVGKSFRLPEGLYSVC